jgi:glycine/serine hydroxymethyltransferase
MDEKCGLDRLWKEIKNRAFPGSTSNHHLGTLLALLVSSYEMNIFKNELQSQVIKNARAFARALYERGIRVEGEAADGFTETHQVLIRVRQYGTGEDMAGRLEKNNIITNYQALPDDDSFIGSSGIRMGVQEMTRFGMRENDFVELAEYVAACLKNDIPVADKVTTLRARFLTMQYCLSAEEAAPLAARLFSSIFAESELVKTLSEELNKALKG